MHLEYIILSIYNIQHILSFGFRLTFNIHLINFSFNPNLLSFTFNSGLCFPLRILIILTNQKKKKKKLEKIITSISNTGVVFLSCLLHFK